MRVFARARECDSAPGAVPQTLLKPVWDAALGGTAASRGAFGFLAFLEAPCQSMLRRVRCKLAVSVLLSPSEAALSRSCALAAAPAASCAARAAAPREPARSPAAGPLWSSPAAGALSAGAAATEASGPEASSPAARASPGCRAGGTLGKQNDAWLRPGGSMDCTARAGSWPTTCSVTWTPGRQVEECELAMSDADAKLVRTLDTPVRPKNVSLLATSFRDSALSDGGQLLLSIRVSPLFAFRPRILQRCVWTRWLKANVGGFCARFSSSTHRLWFMSRCISSSGRSLTSSPKGASISIAM
mmetsp:Transcript_111799/g.339954  ORF Transcript_111799/g.339954 Transcript_111799/m.339954 type:complete len:301 (+) Transcript_111799:3-905(+)